MDSQLETLILKHLLNDDVYCRTVIPFLKPSYFGNLHKSVFKEICTYVEKYNKLPKPEQLKVEIEDATHVKDSEYPQAIALIDALSVHEPIDDIRWITDQTERWCQESAMKIAVMTSVDILSGTHKTLDKGAIPTLMTDALSITFDNSIGHDYFLDAEGRWERYHEKAFKIPMSLDILNDITNGGIEPGTLNIILAGTHVGKSLIMCHEAARAVLKGKKVLYFSMEMSEDKVAERIDANILHTEIDRLEDMDKATFVDRVRKAKERSGGDFIAKQFPTGAAHVGHLRAVLEELKLKKQFVPDLICVDYLNIMASQRIKGLGGSVNTYVLVKAIAEELRGLAVEFKAPIWSATQTNRTGFTSSDVGLEDTAESFGLPATADFMLAVMQPGELKASGQYLVKQLKNRYRNMDYKERFTIGVDKARMKIFDSDGGSGLVNTETGQVVEPKKRFTDFDFGE